MKVKLKNVRLSFPDLFVARPFKAGDQPKFGAQFLVKKGSPLDKEIQAAILAVANAKWPGKGAGVVKTIKSNPNKYCYQDGDTRDYDGYEGMMALSAKNAVRPLVLDRDKSPLTQEDGKPYAGCYVNATVEIFGYTNSGNGISAELKGVQFVKDGDAFSAGSPADPDDFDDLSDGADADDEDDLA